MLEFLDRLSLSAKLRLAPALLLALMLLLGVVVWTSLNGQARTLKEVTLVRQARSDDAARLSEAFRLTHAEVYQLLSWIGAEFSANRTGPLEKRLRERLVAIGQQAAELRKGELQVAETQAVDGADKAIKGYAHWVDEVLKLAAADMSMATQMASKLDIAFAEALKNLDTLREQERALVGQTHTEALASTERLQQLIGALVLAAIVLAGVISMVLRQRLLASLRELRDASARLADGDFSAQTQVHGSDEVADIAQALNSSCSQLGGLVAGIQGTAESVHSEASEISQGSRALSGHIESQAASLEQTAASLQGLTESLQETARNVKTVDAMAEGARRSAEAGGASTVRVRETMQSIKAASDRITDITGVVDSLAFQTNILALNAAVEAARAGEHGRGFAVVASEVRSLAQRSAAAAKEIKTLIGESATRIETGTGLAATAETSMGEISSQIVKLGQLLSGITATVAEQAGSIAELNGAVASIDQASQQNAALVERSNAAAALLLDRSQELRESTARFVIRA